MARSFRQVFNGECLTRLAHITVLAGFSLLAQAQPGMTQGFGADPHGWVGRVVMPGLGLQCTQTGRVPAAYPGDRASITVAPPSNDNLILLVPAQSFGVQAASGQRRNFSFTVNGQPLGLAEMVYLQPEAAFAANAPRNSGLIAALRSGRQATIRDEATGRTIALDILPLASLLAQLEQFCAGAAPPTTTANAAPNQTAAPTAAQNLASWQRLGVPIVGDRILLAGSGSQNENVAKAFSLIALAANTDKPTTMELVFDYAASFLSPAEQMGLLGAHLTDSTTMLTMAKLKADQFRARDVLTSFDRNYRGQLAALAPSFPVKALSITGASLREYDFERQVYVTSRSPEGNNIKPSVPLVFSVVPHGSGRGHIRMDIAGYSGDIPMTPEAARQLYEISAQNGMSAARANELMISGYDPRGGIYLATEMDLVPDLTDYSLPPFSTLMSSYNMLPVEAKVTSARFYLDKQLRHPIADVPVVRAKLILPTTPLLPDWHALNSNDLIAIAAAKGLTEADLSAITGTLRMDANEFERPAAIAQAVQGVRTQQPPQGALYLSGSVLLGQYDGTGFPVTSHTIAVASDQASLWSQVGYTVNIENPAALQRLNMPTDVASKLVEGRAQRSFQARFRVEPVRAQYQPDKPRTILLDFVVKEIALVDPDYKDRSVGLITVADSPAARPAEAQTPQSALLTVELVTMLQMMHAGFVPDDALWREWILFRLETERGEQAAAAAGRAENLRVDGSPWGWFFPAGQRDLTEADIARMMPAFREWIAGCMTRFPQQLRYETDNEINTYVRLTREHQISPQSPFQGLRVGDDMFEWKPDLGTTGYLRVTGMMGFPDLTSYGSGPAKTRLVIMLPDLPLPEEGPRPSGLSLSFAPGKAQAVQTPDDPQPVLLLEMHPTSVEWWGPVAVSTPRPPLGKFPVTDAPAPPAPATPAADDAATPQPQAELDILGVRLGMPMDEAMAALAPNFPVSRVLELSTPNNLPANVGIMARLYIDTTGLDFMVINYGPISLEPRVMGIARSIFVPSGQFSDADFDAMLTQKYGKSESRLWSPVELQPGCATPGAQPTVGWYGAKQIEGDPLPAASDIGAAATDPARRDSVLVVNRISNLLFGLGEATAGCNPILRAELYRNFASDPPLVTAGQSYDALSFRLVDSGAQRRAFEAAFVKETSPDGVAPPPQPKIQPKL